MSRHYFITDVFAEGPYSGNQLATLPDAADLSGEEMQKIARAFNFAETTFITGGSVEDGFDVRIFTPTEELPFAGHPTLGTSYVIRNHLLESNSKTVTLNLGIGPISVSFAEDGVLWMAQNEPEFGEIVSHDRAALTLGLDVSDLDANFPCQMVSTGLEFLLIPLRSYEALKRSYAGPNDVSRTVFTFCEGGYTHSQGIQARMFATELGVSEDPATGSANGCLAAYLAEHAYLGDHVVDTCVGQGYEIARPSQLYLRSEKRSSGYNIQVGGRVNLVAVGQWLV
ncbi:MAG: PhzF family phenazine biosynthesis protein [Pseudomonadales bacterium]|nr:PhzF family phenazine biosynthesis protein [Pseudomonadales bacterium]MBO7005980.1 PhzF family phenazine biosynthesis protein [Pseudomonadales bacterium]